MLGTGQAQPPLARQAQRHSNLNGGAPIKFECWGTGQAQPPLACQAQRHSNLNGGAGVQILMLGHRTGPAPLGLLGPVPFTFEW